MLQRYHLLIRQTDDDRVLVDRRVGRWLLPIVSADARARAPHVVSCALERLNIDGTVACVTAGVVDTHAAGIDWLAIVDQAPRSRSGDLDRERIDDLLVHPALLTIQPDLIRSYQRLLRRVSSTLRRDLALQAAAWATERLLAIGEPDGARTIVQRADLLESTWELRARSASFFFKWRVDGWLIDPDIAEMIAAAGAARAPRTIARDQGAGFWLAAAVHGARLAGDLSAETIGRVAEAMARTQMELRDAVLRLRSIGVRDESLGAIAQLGERILDRLPSCDSAVQAARSAIRRACDALAALEIADSWVHTDFGPENVFVDGDVVSLIDFDDPWIGLAPVVMEFMFAGLRRYLRDPGERSAAVSAARNRFVRVWADAGEANAVERAFASTRVVAEVLRISRRLRSIDEQEQIGELCGLADPAALESARRLTAVANAEPSP